MALANPERPTGTNTDTKIDQSLNVDLAMPEKSLSKPNSLYNRIKHSLSFSLFHRNAATGTGIVLPFPHGPIPTPEEADEYNQGKRRGKVLEWIENHPRLFKLGIAGTTTAATTVASYAAYDYNPAVHESVDNFRGGMATWWNSIIKSSQPSEGEVFNGRANKGEITTLNSTDVSLEDALQRVRERTKADNKYYFILPKIGPDSKITYEKKTVMPTPGQPMQVTGINGLSEDDIFVTPYDAVLTWQKYELGGGMGIRIKKMEPLEGADPNIPAQIEYRVKNGKLLISEDKFNVGKLGSPGAQTIYSSELAINAGTPIFRVLGPETIGGNIFGDNQVGVIGADVLEDSTNAKAITTQTPSP